MSELTEALDAAEARLSFADKVIKEAGITPHDPNDVPTAASHSEHWKQTQCQKCSMWLDDNYFSTHWYRCPWKCGICGELSHSYKKAQDHAWKCSLEKLDKEID